MKSDSKYKYVKYVRIQKINSFISHLVIVRFLKDA